MAMAYKNTIDFSNRNVKYVMYFFLIFFSVGFAGLAIQQTQNLFIKLFPFALLLSFFAILLFHKEAFDTKTKTVFTMIGLVGFLIEVAGVHTHLIFGNYQYGDALGIKVFNAPLLIGINWIMLTYASSAITENMPAAVILKIIFASLIMLVYDILLEQVAPVLDMWYWSDGQIPLQNYIAWFIVSVIFQTSIRFAGIKTRNPVAVFIILLQILFFISLIVFNVL